MPSVSTAHDLPMAEPPRPSMRWLLAAPLLMVFAPVWVQRRLDGIRLWQAFALHLLGGLLVLAAIGLIEAWSDSDLNSGLPGIWVELNAGLRDLATQVLDLTWGDGLMLGIWLIFGFVFVEAAVVVVAWGMSAWAARAEPFGHTFYRALLRAWLLTSHAVLYIGVFGGTIVFLERSARFYRKSVSYSDRPWWVRHEEYILIPLWALLIGLLVVTMLRVFASGRWAARCVWPAMCEGCGYNLMGQPAEGRCPECGKAVRESTIDSPRSRTLNTPGRPVTIVDWLWCTAQALTRPAELGRRLMSLCPTRGKALFMACNLGGIAMVNAVGLTLILVLPWLERLTRSHIYRGFAWDEWLLSILLLVSITTVIAWAFMLTAASLVGTLAHMLFRRNLLPLAVQGTLCLGPMLAMWTAVAWAVILLLYLLFNVLELDTYQWMGIYADVLVTGTFIALACLMIASYLGWLARIVWAGRYANQ